MANNKFQATSLLPFELYNIEDFINNKHPVIHTQSSKYQRYWDEQTKRCIEGFWGYDFDKKRDLGGYRFMPGNLYFYINMTPIKKEGKYGKEETLPPDLRDVEWKIFYGLTACDGFSGFSEDKFYTSFEPVGKLEKGLELTEMEKFQLEQYADEIRNPDTGEFKKFVDAREYLYQTFKEPLGKPLYANQAQNLILLSTRRLGKSYSINGGVITYDFTFNGARTFEDYVDKKTSTTVVVGADHSKDSWELLTKFNLAHDYLKDNIGAYAVGTPDQKNGCYWTPFEGSLNPGKHITNRVKKKGGKSSKGQGSRIGHVTYRDNANAGVGYAARRMIVEEAGLLSNFEEVHGENSATQERETKFGYSIYIGTGGNIEKIKGIREAFYNPRGYKALPYIDKWNRTNKEIGLFIPSYFRKNIYKDPQGNTDYKKAFKDTMQERERLKKNSSRQYERSVISFPIVPQEMFLKSSGNVFPTGEIQDRINYLETGTEWKQKAQVGNLYYMDASKRMVAWELDTKGKLSPIVRWGDEEGRDDKELEGAFVIYEHPIQNLPQPKYHNPLYIVFYDPVKDDGEGSSLACCFVLKLWDFDNPRGMRFNIVAEWIGRHKMVKDCHERAFKLAAYYNAKMLPEIMNPDIIRHGTMTGRFDMFQPKPGLAIKGMVNQKKKYEVGVYVSPTMKPQLEIAAAELVNTIVDKDQQIVENRLETKVIRMVDEMWSFRALEEMLYYERDKNFDYVSCILLAGLWIREQELRPQSEDDVEKDAEEELLQIFAPKEDNKSFFKRPRAIPGHDW